MGYLHINNLYREQDILLFKEAFALEKIHGTSAHVKFDNGTLTFFSGGEKHANFILLFDHEALKAKFEALAVPTVTIYGEAYGGKQQGQSWRYGKTLKFIAFDVLMYDSWLSVDKAEKIVQDLGLEFVHYKRIPTTMEAIDAERDAASEQAKRNGVVAPCPREGVVLRPVIEVTKNNGGRIIAKHKRDEERETTSVRTVADPASLQVLKEAEAIADEWVTPTRLDHVLDKIPGANIEQMGVVIRAMVEDVAREAAGEIVPSDEARKAISKRAALLFKQKLQNTLKEVAS